MAPRLIFELLLDINITPHSSQRFSDKMLSICGVSMGTNQDIILLFILSASGALRQCSFCIA